MEENNIDRNGIFWLDINCALWAHERKDIVRYTGDIQLKFSKAKLMVAGLVLAAACVVAPQQLKAEVPAAQMDGVMGQSMEDETAYEETPNLDGLIMQGAAATYSLPTMRAATGSSYSQDFLDSSFTTAGTYTRATYYHKVDYEDYQLFNGIDVSWWQTKDKKVTSVNWEKAHDAGIDFAFVRVGSRDTADGSIYFDTAADSHIQAALDNDINIGLYIFSQALTEKEAREEANFVLKQLKKYDWDVTLPIVIDREKGSHNRLTGGKLSKTKETAVCQAFADTITKAGYQASVYASYAWIKSYIDTDSLDKCGIWIARYNNTTTSNSKSGSAYGDVPYDYDFWQYSSVSRVSGYTGNLDKNFWYSGDGNPDGKERNRALKNDPPTETTRLNYNGYFYATKVFNAVYNDYAEYFEKGSNNLEPGDVLEVNDDGKYVKSSSENSKRVVGVYSDTFGHLLGGNGDGNDVKDFVPVGLAGRVNVKVVGDIEPGDLLVSSSIPGVAMKKNAFSFTGTVIGKALEFHNGDSVDRIKMLIMNR